MGEPKIISKQYNEEKIDFLLYSNLVQKYITKDNKLNVIKNSSIILKWLDKICNYTNLLSENEKSQLTDDIEETYKIILSIYNKTKWSESKKSIYNREKQSQLFLLSKKCIEIFKKCDRSSKIEVIDIYEIIKMFIFEKKDLNTLKTIFSKVPTLLDFEENNKILDKVLDKYINHLLQSDNKHSYYKKVLEYFLNLKGINISKEKRKDIMNLLTSTKVDVKKQITDRVLVKNCVNSLDDIICSMKTNNLYKDINALNKKYNISREFNNGIIKEAKNIIAVPYKSYTDLTEKYIVSIDSFGTLSIDDAFSFEKTEDGNYVLEVYISDLTPYISRFSLIDNEAYKRCFTIFLRDNYIPMLPPSLANNYLSLKKNEKRYVIAHRLVFSNNMDFISFDIYNAIIKVNKNYNYKNISDILNGSNKTELLYFKNILEFMDKIYSMHFFNDEYHNIKQIKRILNSNHSSYEERDNTIGSKIISTFMILINYFEANKFSKMQVPFIYRINESKFDKRILEKINIQSKDSTKVSEILKLINENYSSSRYSVSNLGHQGLNLDSYSNITNPIRNYASLTCQRLENVFLSSQITDDLIYSWENFLNKVVENLNNKKDNNAEYIQEYYEICNKIRKKTKHIERYYTKE